MEILSTLFYVLVSILCPVFLYVLVKFVRRLIDPQKMVLQSASWLLADRLLNSGINCLVFFNTKGKKDIEDELIEGIRETYLGECAKFRPFKTSVYMPAWYKKSIHEMFQPSDLASKTPKPCNRKEIPYGEVDEIKNHKFFNLMLTNRRTAPHPKQVPQDSPVKTYLKDLDFSLFGPSYEPLSVHTLDLSLHYFFHEMSEVKWIELVHNAKSLSEKKTILDNFNKSMITNKPDLENLASAIASTSFDPNLPLWNLHVMKHYHPGASDETLNKIDEIRSKNSLSIDEKIANISDLVETTGETVFFFRWHHCGGDGVSGIKLLLYLSKIPEEERRTLLQEIKEQKDAQVLERAAKKAEKQKIAKKEGQAITTCKNLLQKLVKILSLTYSILASTIKILLIKRDDWNYLFMEKTITDPKFRMSWIDTPIQLSEIKRMARSMTNYIGDKKFSINDIMMALLSHVLSQQIYNLEFEAFKKKKVPKSVLQSKSEEEIYKMYQDVSVLNNPDKQFKACLWANTRGGFIKTIVTHLESKELYSDIGALFVELPMAGKGLTDQFTSLSSAKSMVADPKKLRFENFTRKLIRVQSNTEKLKNSVDHVVSNLILKVLPFLPLPIFRLIFDSAAFKCSVSMSNVPGPGYKIIHCRREMDKINFAVPPQGRMPLFACLMSYNNKLFFSVASAEEACGKTFSKELVDLFESEVKFLLDYSKIYEKKE